MSARKAIALLTCTASLGDDYPGALRLGVEWACRDANLDLWVYAGLPSWDTVGGSQPLFGLVDPTRIDGIVVASGAIASYAPLADVVATLRGRCNVPIVLVGEQHEDLPSILIDNHTGVQQAIDHLVEVHRRRSFACIGGPEGHEESEARLASAREAFARHGIACDDRAVVRGRFSVADGRWAMRQLFERVDRLDAVIVSSDSMAHGAIQVIRSRGLACPRDVAVVGFDDAASARYGTPPLTTVRQPTSRLGVMAVEFLRRAWRGQPPAQPIVFDTELVIRESCGCSAAQRAVQGDDDARPISSRLEPLLESLLLSADEATRHANQLTTALSAELSRSARDFDPSVQEPRRGAATGDEFLGALRALLDALPESRGPLDALQGVVSALFDAVEPARRGQLDATFQAARVMLGNELQRLVGAAKLRGDQLTEELRASSQRLARSLSLDALRVALKEELPRLGIVQGSVSLYPACGADVLHPLLGFDHDVEVEAERASFPASELVPDWMARSLRRRSLTVMPLTCELEQLGVAVLELPLGTDAYHLLREQLSAAVKAVRLHEDILSRERVHAQIQQEQRATQERLKSLNVIAGGVAHDLNNALGPLVALPEMIRQELQLGAPSAEVFDDLESIRLAGLRATHAIRDLFALGRPDQAPRTRFDLNRLLGQHAEQLAQLCPPAIDFRLEPQESCLIVRATKSQVVSAVSHLVQNAVEAIDESGSVVVRAFETCVVEPGGEGLVGPGEYAVVQVADTGRGIEADLLPHVLEPFFSANPRRATSKGLGLAIVRRQVRDCGGDVEVRSQPGQGSSFSLYFPLLVTESSRSSPPS